MKNIALTLTVLAMTFSSCDDSSVVDIFGPDGYEVDHPYMNYEGGHSGYFFTHLKSNYNIERDSLFFYAQIDSYIKDKHNKIIELDSFYINGFKLGRNLTDSLDYSPGLILPVDGANINWFIPASNKSPNLNYSVKGIKTANFQFSEKVSTIDKEIGIELYYEPFVGTSNHLFEIRALGFLSRIIIDSTIVSTDPDENYHAFYEIDNNGILRITPEILENFKNNRYVFIRITGYNEEVTTINGKSYRFTNLATQDFSIKVK